MIDARATVRRGVKRLAAAADRVVPSPRGVVILAYHRVGAGSGLEVDMPIDLFRRQMEALAGRGTAVTLDGALSTLTGGDEPDRDPIVLTFDDGTADFAEHAFPVLADLKLPATLYVATDFVDRGRAFPHDGTPLSWRALRDLHSTGLLTVGSHTHSHRVLGGTDPADVSTELDRSVDLIQEHVQCAPHHFAYPKAVVADPAGEAVVRTRFRSAALAGMRPNPYGRTDPYRLSRSAVQTSDGIRWFDRKADGGMAVEGKLRVVLDRRRYAGAVT